MLNHLRNIKALCNIAIQHVANEVDALVAKRKGYSEIAIHNLINAVEGVLFIDDGVEKNSQGPYVLFPSAIWLAGQDLWSGVIYEVVSRLEMIFCMRMDDLPIVPTNTSKGPLLM